MEAFWRDASFRGAAFFVESFERDGGRRGPDHEFPQKDEGFPEDTGGKMEGHSIEAYVARSVSDPDYASRRDALIDALSQRGPGELVHPAFGTIQVQVRSWKVQERKNRIGLSPFQIQFKQAASATYPTASRSAAAGAPAAGAAGHAAAKGTFCGGFSLGGKSDFLLSSAVTSCERVADLFSLIGSLSGLTMDRDGLLDSMTTALETAVRSGDNAPLAVAVTAFPQAVTGYFEERHKSTRNADGTYRNISSLRGNGPLEPEAATSLFRAFEHESEIAAPIRNTGTRVLQHGNAEAIAAIVRRSAVIEAARVAPFIDWRTLDQAEASRDRIADALEREAYETTDDTLYAALTDLRTLVLSTVAPDTGRLPFLMDYTPTVTLPSLALSHALYGTSDKADELTVINGLRHPGFIPGGEPLRILSHASR